MPELTTAQQTDQMRSELTARFGDGVAVEYVDVYAMEVTEHPDVMRVLARGDVPLPIISIDGKPRFAGGLSSQVVGDALEKQGLVPASR